MTPLWKHPEPDDRPTPGEMLFAACLFLMVIAALFVADILKSVAP